MYKKRIFVFKLTNHDSESWSQYFMYYTPVREASPVQDFIFLGPLIFPSSLHKHFLIESCSIDSRLNTNIKQGHGGVLPAAGVVQEPHVLVQDEVGVPHLLIVLRHQTLDVMVIVKEVSPLGVSDQERIHLSQSSRSHVLSIYRQTLKHLPSHRLKTPASS